MKLTKQQIEEGVKLYEKGASVQVVAKRFGVTRQTMWKHLRKRTSMRKNTRNGAENTFYRGGKTQNDQAQNLLEQAIEDGKIVRPDKCQQCGFSGTFKDGRTAIQAHHSDYNKPLDVMWLCQKCHHEWHKHNTAIKKSDKAKPTAISLFSGIGGIDLAFSQAGFDVVAQVEIEPFCQAVLRKHAPQYWPNAIIHEDVRNVGRHNLPANPDVIFGGFPCTDVSVAGKRAGIKEGKNSGLWYEFARIIGEVRPRFVLLENVPGILHPVKHTRTTYAFEGKARLYQRHLTYYTQAPVYEVLAGLAALGYDAEWGIVSAASVGAPHRRDRWWCVAYPNSQRRHGQRTLAVSASNSQRHIPPPECAGRSIIHALIAGSKNAVGNATGFTGSMATGSEWQHLPDAEGASEDAGYSEAGRMDVRNYSQATDRTGIMGNSASAGSQRRDGDQSAHSEHPRSSGWDAQSPFRLSVDGIRSGLGRHRWPSRPNEPQQEWEAPRTTTEKYKYRRAAIKALGNAVVHQVVYPFAVAIREALEAQDA